MPAGFEKCRKNGGRIRTRTLDGGRYQPMCYLGGEAYFGYVHTKEEASPGKSLMSRAQSSA